jgi:hypothetical protein
MSVTLKCGSQYRVFVSQRRRRIVEARRRLVRRSALSAFQFFPVPSRSPTTRAMARSAGVAEQVTLAI